MSLLSIVSDFRRMSAGGVLHVRTAPGAAAGGCGADVPTPAVSMRGRRGLRPHRLEIPAQPAFLGNRRRRADCGADHGRSAFRLGARLTLDSDRFRFSIGGRS